MAKKTLKIIIQFVTKVRAKTTNKQIIKNSKLYFVKRKIKQFFSQKLTIKSYVYPFVTIPISIILYFVFVFIVIYFINHSKILNEAKNIPEEISVGIAIFYDFYKFNTKEQIIQTMVNAYKNKYIRRMYVFVLNGNQNILSDSSIYQSLFTDIPKNIYVFKFDYQNTFDACQRISLSEIPKFVAFSTKNILVELLTYCNLQNRYSVGLESAKNVDNFNFLHYTLDTIKSVYNLVFEQNYK